MLTFIFIINYECFVEITFYFHFNGKSEVMELHLYKRSFLSLFYYKLKIQFLNSEQ